MALRGPPRAEPTLRVNIQTTLPLNTPLKGLIDQHAAALQLQVHDTYILTTLWLKAEGSLSAVRRMLSQPPAWIASVELPERFHHASVHPEYLFVYLPSKA